MHPVRRAVLLLLSIGLVAMGSCSGCAASASVPTDVTSARIDWNFPISGVVAPPSILNEGSARSLARAIDAAPAWPDGAVACPADDGSSAKITFLRSGQPVATVTARLTGCASVGHQKMPSSAASILTSSGPPGTRVYSNA